MSALDSVISALGAAVTANPKDPALRLHLASVLVDAGQPAIALEHYVAVLAVDPLNLAALKGAATAAEKSNDSVRAGAYRKLHASLAGEVQPAPVTVIPSVAPPATAAQPPRLRVIQGGVPSGGDVEPEEEEELEEDLIPSVTLADVGGLTEVKRRLDMAFLAPMRNPEIRKLYAKKLTGGLLMYGPPGCGKTYIARALAGELHIEKGTDLFPATLRVVFGRGWPTAWPIEYPVAGQLFDFEAEGIRAGKLIALYGCANKFELKLRNAAYHEFTVSLLPLFGGRRQC